MRKQVCDQVVEEDDFCTNWPSSKNEVNPKIIDSNKSDTIDIGGDDFDF